MKTVVIGTRPPELDVVIARRQALQQDRFDEVWKGDYHMADGEYRPAERSDLLAVDVALIATAVRWPS